MLEDRKGGCHCGRIRFRARVDLDLLAPDSPVEGAGFEPLVPLLDGRGQDNQILGPQSGTEA
jgi:hypothetical protein